MCLSVSNELPRSSRCQWLSNSFIEQLLSSSSYTAETTATIRLTFARSRFDEAKSWAGSNLAHFVIVLRARSHSGVVLYRKATSYNYFHCRTVKVKWKLKVNVKAATKAEAEAKKKVYYFSWIIVVSISFHFIPFGLSEGITFREQLLLIQCDSNKSGLKRALTWMVRRGRSIGRRRSWSLSEWRWGQEAVEEKEEAEVSFEGRKEAGR